MYSLDITFKHSPASVSVQRKEEEAAKALYQSVIDAMKGESATLLELTCEKDEDKKAAFFSDQISTAVLNKRSGAAASGRTAGFAVTQAS